MFGFLKDRLKEAVTGISKQIEEEGKEEIKEEVKEIKPTAENSVEETKKGFFSKLKQKFSKKQEEEIEKIPEEEFKEVPIEEIERQREEEKIKEKLQEEGEKAAEKIIEKLEKKEIPTIQELAAKKKAEEIKAKPLNSDIAYITYFVHGTTIDNEQHKSTGQAPGELSELGIKQSEDLIKQIEKKRFDAIFTSDLKRAFDSANITFKGEQIFQDKRLRECNYGKLNQADESKVLYSEHISEAFPEGESLKDVEIRIADFLNEVFEKYKGKRIAIVAHKAPQLAMDVLLKNKSWQQAITQDWRNQKAWQPGWDYEIKNKVKADYKPKEKQVLKEIKEIKEEAKKEVEEEKKAEGKGFFAKIKEKIVTTQIDEKQFDEIFWQLEVILLENNVAVEVIEKIKQDLKKNIVDKPIKRGQVEEVISISLKETISEILNIEKQDILKRIKEKEKKPFIICFVGINGSGKTTTIAKIAEFLKKNNISVVLAAGDTFRAAAIDQLQKHGDKLGIKVIKQDYGSDAAAVAFDAIKHAESKGIDAVLIDTAGRMHSNVNLMDELKKIIRVAKPDMKIFIGESITGNDCTEQAKSFNEEVGIDGIILSKADIDEKGGAAISVSYITGKPILYIGTGQEYEDIKEFDKNMILEQLGL